MVNINYSYKYANDNFIKGISLEFADKPIDTKEEEYDFWEWSINKFMNRADEYFSDLKRIGFTHIFIHFWFRVYYDENSNLHLRLQNEGFDFNKLFKKCNEYNLKPVIKIMLEHKNNYDTRELDNPKLYFQEYKELTKKILDYDNDNLVELITIANETELLRSNLGYRDYWKEYIEWLRKDYPRLKISMSHFIGDINSGKCDILDLVDIIGVNYYPSINSKNNYPSVNEVLKDFYTKDIYALQEYCKYNNKSFIITESGCSNWNYQYKEPEQGDSMQNYYNTGYNMKVSGNYDTGVCIATSCLEYCDGCCILGLGGNYDPFYETQSYQLDKSLKRNYENIFKISDIWGEKIK